MQFSNCFLPVPIDLTLGNPRLGSLSRLKSRNIDFWCCNDCTLSVATFEKSWWRYLSCTIHCCHKTHGTMKMVLTLWVPDMTKAGVGIGWWWSGHWNTITPLCRAQHLVYIAAFLSLLGVHIIATMSPSRVHSRALEGCTHRGSFQQLHSRGEVTFTRRAIVAFWQIGNVDVLQLSHNRWNAALSTCQ